MSDLAFPHIGGVEYVVFRYSSMLREEGHENYVLTTLLPGTSRKEMIKGVKYIRLSKAKLALGAPFVVKKLQPDLVHTHSYLASLSLSYAWRVSRKRPIIRHIHDVYIGKYEEYSGWEGSKIYERFERFAIKLEYTAYITPSNYTKQRLEEIGLRGEDIHVVHPGVELEKFERGNQEYLHKKYGIPEEKKIIGFVGRLSTGKGPQDLIEAAKDLDAYVVLVGPNPNPKTSGILGIEERLKKMVKRYGLDKRVIFAGKIRDEEIPHYYASFDVFCLPSISEGFGMSIAEALAAGVPVVSYRTSAIPEIVKEGYNGLLAEPRNVEELRNKLEAMLSDEKLYERIKRNTRKSVQNFSWENSFRRLLEVYSRYL